MNPTSTPSPPTSADTTTGPELRIRVLGDPIPQGSMIAIMIGRRPQVVPSNAAKLRPWRKTVTTAATNAMRATNWLTLDTACRVDLWFLLERPTTAPRSRHYPEKPPDLDKLQRAILDALTTARVYTDDSRAVTITAGKRYATAGEQPGALIIIRPITASLI